jgi:hypothetical protein
MHRHKTRQTAFAASHATTKPLLTGISTSSTGAAIVRGYSSSPP